MTEYTVTMRINDDNQYLHFVKTVGPVVDRLVVSVKETEQAPADFAPQTPVSMPKAATSAVKRGPRGPRGSKVNDTVLQALGAGAKTGKEIKAALEAAGLAPGSWSTCRATLLRDGRVKQTEDGNYQLAA